MKRILTISVLALAACGAGTTNTGTSATTSPPSDSVRAREIVETVPTATMFAICDAGKEAVDRGATSEQIVETMRESLRSAANEQHMPVDTLASAIAQWCLDHGYQ
jgi:hypothetical protein